MRKATLSIPVLLVGLSSAASAQLISIRTVPVSQAHQFQIFPSRTLAMGGVSIAVEDSLLDPFVNPAKGVRIGTTQLFGAPSMYSVSSEAGGGRTLPLGALTRYGNWYGGVWAALQEVDASRGLGGIEPVPLLCPACSDAGIELGVPARSDENTYAYVMFGRDMADGLSIGGSFMWSGLNAIDGVDLLYANSARIEQHGNAFDVRLGLLKEFPGDRSLEALVLFNRFATAHDVLYLDGFWDPGTQQFRQRPRVEQNLDRTSTFGLHMEYERPLTPSGWRAGFLLTANRMDHPKIPNYEIMNIPRDPGHSSAFNLGVGVSRRYDTSTFAMDVIYEPIWSHTWADAAEPTEAHDGRTIPAGGMTIENHFRFSNAAVRLGLGKDLMVNGPDFGAGLQLGLNIRTIHYWLDQQDHVQGTARSQEERWREWSPTWGLSLRFPELEIRYRGSATHGTGRPGVAGNFVGRAELDLAAGGSNILLAPSGPLTLTEVRVMTHQVSVSLPMR